MVFKKKLALFLFCAFFIVGCGQKAATVNVETVVSQDVEIVQGNREQAEDKEQEPDRKTEGIDPVKVEKVLPENKEEESFAPKRPKVLYFGVYFNYSINVIWFVEIISSCSPSWNNRL